ncbi:MAG: type VI secretion system baseplate subunit TssF [Pseudomonadales bacterium]|nr:type VI secretion system baseplate subunit TssF [Pseudomonadales bacterium]
MTDELLSYYEKELAYLRQSGGQFAETHPKIAGRLKLSEEIVEDPHVSRLLEGVAYLNARIQKKLDDEFPELTDALLEVLYPHYLQAIPSTSVIQFKPADDLDCHYAMPANTLLETEPFHGQTCQFRTSYPVDLHPITISKAKYSIRPFNAPGSDKVKGAQALLQISIKSKLPGVPIKELNVNSLRFYLRGQPQHRFKLYEQLLNNNLKVAIADDENEKQPMYLNRSSIQAVGLKDEDGVLPYPENAFTGYRLLTEFFACPEKFLFIDINNIYLFTDQSDKEEFHLYIYLNQADPELERNLSADNLALGCSPIINLFEHTADPIPLNQEQSEYKVVADVRASDCMEIHSITQVKAIQANGEQRLIAPLYQTPFHNQRKDKSREHWLARRQDRNDTDGTTNTLISITDLDFNRLPPADETLNIKTLCFNRNLPSKLPFGGGQPALSCVGDTPPIKSIHCLTPPTEVIRPAKGRSAQWKLISHLNLNHLSLGNSPEALLSLKELLNLYNFNSTASSQALIDSITKLNIVPTTAPISLSGKTTLCRGTEITLELDDSQLSGTNSYLFSSILESFFALHCSINTFTRLIVNIKGKDGALKKWPPRAGEKALI